MKNLFLLISSVVLIQTALISQTAPAEFDKKYRFGLRITPQPSWFITNDKNLTPNGAVFGFGFGLNMEYRFSEIACLLTGIGGDFEGGKYKFRYDPANNYEVTYWMDDANEFAVPSQKEKTTRLVFTLKERTIKTTFATIPLILKLSTKEYNGMKYFGMFGGEVGVRVKMQANDTYYQTVKYVNDTVATFISAAESTENGLIINKEGSLVPLRIGLNVGAGAEYRLGGTTSLFASVNFFRSFTNLMRKESDYTIYRTDRTNGKESYKFVKQNLMQNAIRINIGIMF